MKNPNRIDDRFHAGLFALALCLAIAVIAGTPDLGTPQATARAGQPAPMAINTTADPSAATGPWA